MLYFFHQIIMISLGVLLRKVVQNNLHKFASLRANCSNLAYKPEENVAHRLIWIDCEVRFLEFSIFLLWKMNNFFISFTPWHGVQIWRLVLPEAQSGIPSIPISNIFGLKFENFLHPQNECFSLILVVFLHFSLFSPFFLIACHFLRFFPTPCFSSKSEGGFSPQTLPMSRYGFSSREVQMAWNPSNGPKFERSL